MVLLVNERGKYIVEEGAHDECMSTFWMGLLFETDSWQLLRGFYSTGEQSMGVVKGSTLVSLPCQTEERTKKQKYLKV